MHQTISIQLEQIKVEKYAFCRQSIQHERIVYSWKRCQAFHFPHNLNQKLATNEFIVIPFVTTLVRIKFHLVFFFVFLFSCACCVCQWNWFYIVYAIQLYVAMCSKSLKWDLIPCIQTLNLFEKCSAIMAIV